MTARHRQLRLVWAGQQLQTPFDWTKVFFVDEKPYMLDRSRRRQKVLYDQRDPTPSVARRTDEHRSLHIWGAFSLDVVPLLAPISTHFNAAEYISVLATRFIPYAQTHPPICCMTDSKFRKPGRQQGGWTLWVSRSFCCQPSHLISTQLRTFGTLQAAKSSLEQYHTVPKILNW